MAKVKRSNRRKVNRFPLKTVLQYNIKGFLFFATGNIINVETGEWSGKMSGVGAGLDSFYEYLLKVTCNVVAIVKETILPPTPTPSALSYLFPALPN